MDALHPDELRGNWAPLLVPFDARGRLARRALEEEIGALLESEVDGIASGPEVEQLSDEEFDAVHSVLARRCTDAGAPFMFATHAPDIDSTMRRMLRSARRAPGAFRVRVPAGRRFGERSAARCLRQLAGARGAAGLVWELSLDQQRALDGATLTRLVRAEPALVGLELAFANEDLLESLRPLEDELSILVPGEALATGRRHGARGSVSLLACLNPGAAQGYCDALEDQMDAALTFELRLQRFLETHVRRAAPSLATRAKLLCAIGGWCDLGLATRPAWSGLAELDLEHLQGLTRDALPEFF